MQGCRKPSLLHLNILKNSMPSNQFADASCRCPRKKIISWITVAVYTATLPFVILAFRVIEHYFPPPTTGRIPLLIIAVMAAVYGIICIRHKAATRCIITLAAAGLIVFGVVVFEDNANKYIHIPEYIIMAWLLYRALAIDYRGSGIWLLVFLCALMLGMVDELLQGIHPQRTYGWQDMIIDAASSFIGILSLLGLKAPPGRTWNWLKNLKAFKGALAVLLVGAAAAVPMGVYLFDVQDQGNFFSAYPPWLLVANSIFIPACVAVIIFHWRRKKGCAATVPEIDQISLNNHTTAMLWVICPLTILLCMHALVVWVAVAGVKFR
jgi:hypothetical protein